MDNLKAKFNKEEKEDFFVVKVDRKKHAKAMRRYQKKNLEKYRQASKKYYDNNKEKILAKMRLRKKGKKIINS